MRTVDLNLASQLLRTLITPVRASGSTLEFFSLMTSVMLFRKLVDKQSALNSLALIMLLTASKYRVWVSPVRD